MATRDTKYESRIPCVVENSIAFFRMSCAATKVTSEIRMNRKARKLTGVPPSLRSALPPTPGRKPPAQSRTNLMWRLVHREKSSSPTEQEYRPRVRADKQG